MALIYYYEKVIQRMKCEATQCRRPYCGSDLEDERDGIK